MPVTYWFIDSTRSNPISHNIIWWMPPNSIHQMISFRSSHSLIFLRTSSYPKLINSITELNIDVYSMNFPLVTYDIDWLVATYEITSHCGSAYIKFWKLINHVSLHAIALCHFQWTLGKAGFGSGFHEVCTRTNLTSALSQWQFRGR